jgi:CRP-like cAMP-binding protein
VKGKRLIFKESDAISSEGEIAKGWYLLLKGRVAVYKKNLKVAEFARKGEVFGELSGILNQPRTATLKALEKTEVLFIKGGLDTLITDHPRVARKVMVNLAERLSETTDHWWMSVKEQKGNRKA